VRTCRAGVDSARAVRSFWYDRVDSTNEQAKRLAAAGAIGECAFVVAREQIAGKGTSGRHWVSPRDAGLYLSLVERFPAGAARPLTALHSIAAGVACAQMLEGFDADVRVKPVNDLVAGGRKLGGILTEAVVEDGRCTLIVTGIGINLRRAERRLPLGAMPAISLEEILAPHRRHAARADSIAFGLIAHLLRWSRLAADGDVDRVRRGFSRYARPGTTFPEVFVAAEDCSRPGVTGIVDGPDQGDVPCSVP